MDPLTVAAAMLAQGAATPAARKDLLMLRFAPRYGIVSPCLVRPTPASIRRAANDNPARRPAPAHWTGDDAMLEAALRLFGIHGLSAASYAANLANTAQRDGDFEKARWWMGVTRLLNGRTRASAAER